MPRRNASGGLQGQTPYLGVPFTEVGVEAAENIPLGQDDGGRITAGHAPARVGSGRRTSPTPAAPAAAALPAPGPNCPRWTGRRPSPAAACTPASRSTLMMPAPTGTCPATPSSTRLRTCSNSAALIPSNSPALPQATTPATPASSTRSSCRCILAASTLLPSALKGVKSSAMTPCRGWPFFRVLRFSIFIFRWLFRNNSRSGRVPPEGGPAESDPAVINLPDRRKIPLFPRRAREAGERFWIQAARGLNGPADAGIIKDFFAPRFK